MQYFNDTLAQLKYSHEDKESEYTQEKYNHQQQSANR